jgi:aryl-alcohol dehydrogenase-like predicted oxidoreductase
VRTPLFQPGTLERCLEVADALLPYCRKYGKTQGQVAINWLTGREGITSAIIGARTAAQAEENAGAGGWRLSSEDAAEIDRIGRSFTDTLPRYVSFFMSKVKE